MANAHGSIEVITPNDEGWRGVRIKRVDTTMRHVLSTNDHYPDLKWDDKLDAYVARQLRIPVGEYMVKWRGHEEWVRVHEDDLTTVDFR